jgi:apolipoprotein N-acyltransferase
MNVDPSAAPAEANPPIAEAPSAAPAPHESQAAPAKAKPSKAPPLVLPRLGALPLDKRFAYPAAALGGLLYWLSFPGVDAWPLAFVAFAPLLVALHRQAPKRALALGVVNGLVMNVFGFYWLQTMLQTFSGFPAPVCFLFVLIICMYQGGRGGLLGWLYARASARGWPAMPMFLAAFVASELVYPLLFPWYFAASLHNVPALTQVADLGGPILIGLVVVTANLAIAEPILARLEGRPFRPKVAVGALIPLVLSAIYGAIRIKQVDAAVQTAPPVKVGLVQGNMGLLQKREDPAEGLRRHLRMTQELKQKGAELVVWSESSVTFAVPEEIGHALMHDRVGQHLGIPAIIGGVYYRDDPDRERFFNTALSTDEKGYVNGRYDKHFLLAFGEYLPFGDTFPVLYDWSPHSGRFSPGTKLDPLIARVKGADHVVSALICYEDILPGFTNGAVSHANPELLVNMTNDAWFGDTSEPWEHLALAQFRAIEHRRYLVRSTNSGVSAFVDPVGRVVSHTQTFKTESQMADIHWMRASTVYEAIGDSLWYLTALGVTVLAFLKRKPREARETGAMPAA